MNARVVVIGGGFAGVAAAASLRALGAEVAVLDDRSTLGGRARSDVLEGMIVDTGAQLITTAYTRTRALLGADASGGASPLHPVPGRDAFVRGAERFPIQFGSIRSLLGFAGLGAMDKLRLARRVLPAMATHHAGLDASAARVPASLDARDAHAFIASRVGEHAADVLVEPPLNGFYAARGRESSVAFFLMLGRYGSDEVRAPVAGWSAALAGALRGARHERDVRVERIEREGAGVVARAADGRAWHADAAVIATGPRSARALLAPLLPADDALARWLGAVPLRRTWTLALALDAAAPRDAFGIFRAASEARMVSACAVQGATWASPPPDRDVVLAWPTPNAAAALGDAPAERIAAAMLPEVEALVPVVRGHVTRARVYRFREGTPLPYPGFAADRAAARALADALPHPVALAGDYLTAPLIEGAVASGNAAAERLAAIMGER